MHATECSFVTCNMGIDPNEVRTVTLGAAAGLGESDLTRIDIVGEELQRLKFRVRLPEEQLNAYVWNYSGIIRRSERI